MLLEFWHNFRHNLFKPLLLFFYMGFRVPMLRSSSVPQRPLPVPHHLPADRHRLEGGEELAEPLVAASRRRRVHGDRVRHQRLSACSLTCCWLSLTKLRRIDRATVAGYYGSDSAGTFVTCLGVLDHRRDRL